MRNYRIQEQILCVITEYKNKLCVQILGVVNWRREEKINIYFLFLWSIKICESQSLSITASQQIRQAESWQHRVYTVDPKVCTRCMVLASPIGQLSHYVTIAVWPLLINIQKTNTTSFLLSSWTIALKHSISKVKRSFVRLQTKFTTFDDFCNEIICLLGRSSWFKHG